MGKFKRLMPRYADVRAMGAVAAMVVPREVARYAYRQGLYAATTPAFNPLHSLARLAKADSCFVSVASIWEVAIKHHLGQRDTATGASEPDRERCAGTASAAAAPVPAAERPGRTRAAPEAAGATRRQPCTATG
ncbi:MAG: hypothetical protein RKP73_04020 [Candidatus Contendobacter sp.]|nr:hypothetical protein [Candidatus Contendobacter sp.]